MHVLIDGVDRTRLVDGDTLRITQVITSEPDTAEFVIKKFGDRTFVPAAGMSIAIKQDGVNIFAGSVTNVDEAYDVVDYVAYRLTCIDYTYHLDQRLMVTSYQSMTVQAILEDMVENWLPSDVTIDGVDCDEVIDYVAFNYEPPSQALARLAALAGADWYIDYYKDIHFSVQASEDAPFNLTDTGGKYVYASLVVRRDQTQLRNVVIVKGGDYLANTTTAVIDGTGAQRYFNLPFKFSNLELTVTGAAKSVGVDPIDDPTKFDAMHNFQEKTVFFREDRIPRDTTALAASQKVRISGNPNLPILVREQDGPSISMFTAREHFVEDASIKTKAGARARALAELEAYKTTLAEAEFDTYEMGLHTGQKINVQSDLRGLDEDYIINRIEWRVFGMDADGECPLLVCHVQLVTTRTFELTQLFQRLINKDREKTVVDDSQILERVEAFEDAGGGAADSMTHSSHGNEYRWSPSSLDGVWGRARWG